MSSTLSEIEGWTVTPLGLGFLKMEDGQHLKEKDEGLMLLLLYLSTRFTNKEILHPVVYYITVSWLVSYYIWI